ncbi:hypothetical protein ACWCQZ_50105 [Streptomyces sp. NPDC002285]
MVDTSGQAFAIGPDCQTEGQGKLTLALNKGGTMQGTVSDAGGQYSSTTRLRQTSAGSTTWVRDPSINGDWSHEVVTEIDGVGRINEITRRFGYQTPQNLITWKHQDVPDGKIVNSYRPTETLDGAFGSYDVGSLAMARNQSGKLELFAASLGANGPGSGGLIAHRRANSRDTGLNGWGDWEYLSPASHPPNSYVTAMAAERDGQGRLHLIALDDNSDPNLGEHIWHTMQTAPDSNTWSSWSQYSTGERLHSIALARNAQGQLEMFGTQTAPQSGGVWHRTMTAVNPNNTPVWSAWDNLAATTTLWCSVAAETNSDGRIELWAADPHNNSWWSTTQLSNKGGGGWEPWRHMSRP